MRPCRRLLATWLTEAARGKRRKLSMVSATCRDGQHLTGVQISRFAQDALRTVLQIHQERLRLQLVDEAAAAAQRLGHGPAQPHLAQEMLAGEPLAATCAAGCMSMGPMSASPRLEHHLWRQ